MTTTLLKSVMEVPEVTARARLREWVKNEITDMLEQGACEFNLPDLTDKAKGVVTAEPAWASAFLGESFRGTVYDFAKRLIGSLRNGERVIELGDNLVPRSLIADRAAARLQNKWGSYLVHRGENYKPILQMTRVDLFAAIAERQKQITTEVKKVRFWKLLTELLQDDDQTVEQAFTLEELETLHQQIQEKEVEL